MEPDDVTEYREELVLSLSLARELAAANIKIAQKIYKRQYDKHAGPVNVKVSDLVLVKFPHEESGRNQKLCMLTKLALQCSVQAFHHPITLGVVCSGVQLGGAQQRTYILYYIG